MPVNLRYEMQLATYYFLLMTERSTLVLKKSKCQVREWSRIIDGQHGFFFGGGGPVKVQRNSFI